MELIFKEIEIQHWAGRYSIPHEEEELLGLRDKIVEAKVLNIEQLRLLAHWKSPRSARYIEENDPQYIQEITSFCLKTKNERARIEPLTTLSGVQWPTASVILHLFHDDQYPILDFRALWSVSENKPIQYTFSYWFNYVKFCRVVANRNNVGMRVLDRALWQYSKENQSSDSSNS